MNASSATQFCGSTIVSVPTGGRKKKLKEIIETTDASPATHRREVAAATRTIRRKLSATVVVLPTCSQRV